jgi:diadenosine tetraphosphate (Ap4A) HIT family hydrolase
MKHYNKDNIFAKIIRGEIPCSKVYEDDLVLAFHDISKAAPTHVLVIPKGEYVDFNDFCSKASSQEISHFFTKVGEIAIKLGVDKSGYRMISNIGSDASQTVPHFHIHIIGGKRLGGLIPGDANVR